MRERLQQILFFLHDWMTYLRFSLMSHRALDYVSMGLGIQARYRRNARGWKPHLEHSRQFLKQALDGAAQGGRVAVLGAGRLYDFPLELLESDRWSFDLYDYDPALRRVWRRFRSSKSAIADLYQHDLTGVMETWSAHLAALPVGLSVEAFATALRELPLNKKPGYRLAKQYDCVISLNLLSQLGLYLRDRVETALVRRQLVSSHAAELPEVIEQALRMLAQQLEKAHLRSIHSAGAKQVIVICDTSYLYYSGASSNWEEVPALQVTPDMGAPYRRDAEESWYWHIAPQGTEREMFGEIHEVRGQVFLSAEDSGRIV